MDKNILLLIASGVALAFLHLPEMAITVGIIAGLVMGAIKIFWTVMQAFSQPVESRRPVPVRSQNVN